MDSQDDDNVPDDGWEAELNNDEGGAALDTLDVYAICDQKHTKADFRYVRRAKEVPDGTQRTKLAACGRRPIVGGGVDSFSRYNHGLYINSTFPNVLAEGQRFWVGTVDNYDTRHGRRQGAQVRRHGDLQALIGNARSGP